MLLPDEYNSLVTQMLLAGATPEEAQQKAWSAVKQAVREKLNATVASVYDRLSEVLEHAATAAEDDLDIAVKSTTSLVEPIMIVGMGAVVGGIASAMLLPIFNMSKNMRPH